MTFRKVGERTVYDGRFVHVVSATFESADGSRFDRELIRHRGAVGVVAIRDGRVVLVRQFRPTVDADVLEIPAGMLDVDGEEPEHAARRELEEEAGLRAIGPLELLTHYYVAIGVSDETMSIYLCRDAEPCTARPQSTEEEHIQVEEVALDDVQSMIDDGRIKDAKTIIGLLHAQRIVGRA